MPANRLRLLASLALGWFLVRTAQLHLAEYSLALHFLLQRLKGLIDIVVADCNVNDGTSPYSSLVKNFKLEAAYITAHSTCEGLSRPL